MYSATCPYVRLTGPETHSLVLRSVLFLSGVYFWQDYKYTCVQANI